MQHSESKTYCWGCSRIIQATGAPPGWIALSGSQHHCSSKDTLSLWITVSSILPNCTQSTSLLSSLERFHTHLSNVNLIMPVPRSEKLVQSPVTSLSFTWHSSLSQSGYGPPASLSEAPSHAVLTGAVEAHCRSPLTFSPSLPSLHKVSSYKCSVIFFQPVKTLSILPVSVLMFPCLWSCP